MLISELNYNQLQKLNKAWVNQSTNPMPIFIFNLLTSSTDIISYTGVISNSITSNLVELMQSGSRKEVHIKTLVTECFQNIIKHAVSPRVLNPNMNKIGFFSYRTRVTEKLIFSANAILTKDCEALKNKIEWINNLEQAQLKKVEREKVQDGIYDEKGGAGMGLIKLALKTQHPINFSFHKISEEQSLFYQQLNLLSNDEKTFADNINLHTEVTKNNILLIYKGHFTQQKLMPLFDILEENLVKHFEESNVKKRIYLTIIEMLQNICKHAAAVNNQKEGVFMLAKRNRKYILYATNFVKKSDSEKLNYYLMNSKNQSQETLKRMVTQKLREGFLDVEGNAGLGLLEISRHCEGDFSYQIEEYNADINYFTLTVKI